MIGKKQIAFVTLTALTLAIPGLGNTKNPVERPVVGYASARWVYNLTDGTATTEQTGVASQLGAFTLTGSGAADFSDFGGVGTASDGSQIFWEMTPGGPFEVTCTGGTGRFEGITGGLNTTWQSEPVVSYPSPGIMLVELTYTFAGRITY